MVTAVTFFCAPGNAHLAKQNRFRMGFPRTWCQSPRQMSLRFCGKKQRFSALLFILLGAPDFGRAPRVM